MHEDISLRWFSAEFDIEKRPWELTRWEELISNGRPARNRVDKEWIIELIEWKWRDEFFVVELGECNDWVDKQPEKWMEFEESERNVLIIWPVQWRRVSRVRRADYHPMMSMLNREIIHPEQAWEFSSKYVAWRAINRWRYWRLMLLDGFHALERFCKGRKKENLLRITERVQGFFIHRLNMTLFNTFFGIGKCFDM